MTALSNNPFKHVIDHTFEDRGRVMGNIKYVRKLWLENDMHVCSSNSKFIWSAVKIHML